jgi:hypothetical protein
MLWRVGGPAAGWCTWTPDPATTCRGHACRLEYLLAVLVRSKETCRPEFPDAPLNHRLLYQLMGPTDQLFCELGVYEMSAGELGTATCGMS